MSRAAEAWFFDECEIRGNAGWVLVNLCNFADDDGYSGLSKKSLKAKTHLSEATIWRVLQAMNDDGTLSFVEGEVGPDWWRQIPGNRRPRLVRLTAFLGSRFALPEESGAAQGSRTVPSGLAQGSRGTPSDLPKRYASVDGVTDTQSRAREAGKCGVWTDVEDAKAWTVAPCTLTAGHRGRHKTAGATSLSLVRADLG